MSTVKRIAEEVAQGLNQILPSLNKPVVRKLSLAVGAMIEGQTPNTVELSNLLPLDTERQDMREQWLRRLLKSPALDCEAVMAPFAQEALRHAEQNGQVILLSMDQTDLGDRMAVLMSGGSVYIKQYRQPRQFPTGSRHTHHPRRYPEQTVSASCYR